MTPGIPSSLLREGLLVLASTGGPILLTFLAVGLLMGILQAATQINDPAVGFVPRIVTGLTVTALLGHWIVERFAHFLASAIERMGSHVG